MLARSRSFAVPAKTIGSVVPAWLEPRLGAPKLRVLDVRADGPPDDASGPRLRTAQTVELSAFAHLGGPAGWRAARDRHPARYGPASAYVRGHLPGAIPFDVRALLFDEAGDVVSAPELAIAMSGAGVGDDHTIVLVDDGRPNTALAAAWALVRYGHQDVHILEGGFTRWVGEGREVSRVLVRHAPASFTARNPS